MSGSKLAASLALVTLCFTCGAGSGWAGDRKKAAESYAIVSGTVFRDPGFALPEAKVVLTLRDDAKARKLQEASTNYRGEFTFRVPPKEAAYVVKASMKGYRPEEKEAAISGEERIEVNLVLTPVSK
jgi:hypothetical protein